MANAAALWRSRNCRNDGTSAEICWATARSISDPAAKSARSSAARSNYANDHYNRATLRESMAKNSNVPTLTIGDKTHPIDSLLDVAKVQLTNLQIVGAEIQCLQQQLGIAQVWRG